LRRGELRGMVGTGSGANPLSVIDDETKRRHKRNAP